MFTVNGPKGPFPPVVVAGDPPQFPNLLSGYALRPPFQVAGVDYYVGVPSSTILKDPNTILSTISGATGNNSTKIVTVSGNNVLLDGYDFSKNNGWQVSLSGNNLTVQNCKFIVGSNNLSPIDGFSNNGGFCTIQHCTFDGGGAQGESPNNQMFQSGTGATVQNNRFTNWANDALNFNNDGAYLVQNNLFDTYNFGSGHSDSVQTFFSAISTPLIYKFNTIYQPPQSGGALGPGSGNSMVRIGDQYTPGTGPGFTINSPELSFNVGVWLGLDHTGGTGGAATLSVFDLSAGFGPDPSNAKLLNPLIHDNYFDFTSVNPYFCAPYGSKLTNPMQYDNWNMVTGNRTTQDSINRPSSAAPPAAPSITSHSTAGSTAVLGGTAVASSVISFIDTSNSAAWPTPLLGTTTSNGSGNWSFTSGALSSGTHVIVARTTVLVTDSYNTSAASSSVSVTI